MAASSIPSETTRNMKQRYRDAYFVSRTIVGFGTAMKVISVVLGIVIVLGVLLMFGETRGAGGMIVGGIVVAVIIGLLLFLLGVLLAAQGQVLQATLDSAVNSSPFLTDADRAEVMSLASQGFRANPPDPAAQNLYNIPPH